MSSKIQEVQLEWLVLLALNSKIYHHNKHACLICKLMGAYEVTKMRK